MSFTTARPASQPKAAQGSSSSGGSIEDFLKSHGASSSAKPSSASGSIEDYLKSMGSAPKSSASAVSDGKPATINDWLATTTDKTFQRSDKVSDLL